VQTPTIQICYNLAYCMYPVYKYFIINYCIICSCVTCQHQVSCFWFQSKPNSENRAVGIICFTEDTSRFSCQHSAPRSTNPTSVHFTAPWPPWADLRPGVLDQVVRHLCQICKDILIHSFLAVHSGATFQDEMMKSYQDCQDSNRIQSRQPWLSSRFFHLG
jgi:hypothetical protein